jgi:predicted ester cyclase
MKGIMSENSELLDRFNTAWLSTDVDAFDDVFAVNYTQYWEEWAMHGVESQKRLCEIVHEAWPDEKFTSDVIYDEGNVITRVRRGGGTSTGNFLELPPNGGYFPVTAVETFLVQDGKIRLSWHVTNIPLGDGPTPIVTELRKVGVVLP